MAEFVDHVESAFLVRSKSGGVADQERHLGGGTPPPAAIVQCRFEELLHEPLASKLGQRGDPFEDPGSRRKRWRTQGVGLQAFERQCKTPIAPPEFGEGIGHGSARRAHPGISGIERGQRRRRSSVRRRHHEARVLEHRRDLAEDHPFEQSKAILFGSVDGDVPRTARQMGPGGSQNGPS